jgi:hypothetical protein
MTQGELEAYAKGVRDADEMVGALWSDLFNKDMVNRGADWFFDKWRARIRDLAIVSPSGKQQH